MRAVLVATVGVMVALLATACGSGKPSAKYPINVYVAGNRVATVAPGHSGSSLPDHFQIHFGVGEVTVHVDHSAATDMIDKGLASGAGRVDLPFTRVWSFITTNLQKQLYPHGSELTALSMLLSDVGIDAPQVHTIKKIALSQPTDQQPIAGSKLFRWGDPEQGFVGKPDRAGAKGGFGVYEPPIIRLAKTYGVTLIDLEGKSVNDVRAALLDGHPVMVWVDWNGHGASSSWLTKSGKKVTADLGERAAILIGTGKGYYLLGDPGSGKEFKWSTSQFASRWQQLGNRALELP